ncbi:MAG: hypothetical protein GYB36_07130 [Alphaproteobacteria bacterium]|nr:hypothetical protein [Alphaproteobacteria bacterium]
MEKFWGGFMLGAIITIIAGLTAWSMAPGAVSRVVPGLQPGLYAGDAFTDAAALTMLHSDYSSRLTAAELEPLALVAGQSIAGARDATRTDPTLDAETAQLLCLLLSQRERLPASQAYSQEDLDRLLDEIVTNVRRQLEPHLGTGECTGVVLSNFGRR